MKVNRFSNLSQLRINKRNNPAVNSNAKQAKVMAELRENYGENALKQTDFKVVDWSGGIVTHLIE